ncbi:MAG: phosphate acyltransferase, partial [Actinomycetota bacterium]|nr:phosphate acyltransferase [Actinomycetota bacterium]
GVRVLLFGPRDELGEPAQGVEVVHAPVSIAKAEDAAAAARSTPDASIVLAARAVAEGRADALVAGGSTGTALAAGLFHVKRDRGIHRPALAVPVPVPGAPVTVVDVGANVEVRAEHLVQFAFMGAALAKVVLGIERPRVALLSNGEEPSRGTPLIREAHAALLERAPGAAGLLDFVGNVDAAQVPASVADVVVADGFTGNVAVKLMEGTSQETLRAIRRTAASSPRARVGGLLLRRALRALHEEIDPEGAGGAYLLGLRRLGVMPHGRYSRHGFARAIELAARGVQGDVVGRTRAALEEAGALRRTGPDASAPAGSVPQR